MPLNINRTPGDEDLTTNCEQNDFGPKGNQRVVMYTYQITNPFWCSYAQYHHRSTQKRSFGVSLTMFICGLHFDYTPQQYLVARSLCMTVQAEFEHQPCSQTYSST